MTIKEIQEQGLSLNPGRYVGVADRVSEEVDFRGQLEELYEEMGKDLPSVGTRVKTKHGRGEVIGWHTLKHSVDVLIDKEKDQDRRLVVEVPIKGNK